ncbi:MFS transporter [Bradyrhizobium sp. NAS96.2]|uniref:MFS transporter n=1 Tax=Bradyrhizobium sp. NAS96.2 TaxID=1680160 RepID=UPI00093FF3BD|nr:MFS transporter [Bradyrhizobium sp. NAS96.2]OKO77069.1 MFS transporter [Bradyrhizobium sp. NAS96.2]
MLSSTDRPAGLLATRLAFFVAGFGFASWAPLVPLAKERLAIDDGVLGLVLLWLGVGSAVAMLVTGAANARYGSQTIILGGGLGLALILPWLVVASTPLCLGAVLFAFGVSLGSIDIAMNVHGTEVERAAGRPLMSGFHAHFCIGEVAGCAIMTTSLSLGTDALAPTLICSALMTIALGLAWPRFLATGRTEQRLGFVLPDRGVLLIATLAAMTFLVEGAMLDWSALFLVDQGLVSKAHGGFGYMLFSIAMTAGRLGGDAVVTRFGDRATLMFGTLPIMAGFAALLAAPVGAIAMAGCLLIGLGAANIVPVLCRRAGKQKTMPVCLAIAVITSAGYTGMLVGPAIVGLISNMAGLPWAFAMLGVLLCAVTLVAPIVMADWH